MANTNAPTTNTQQQIIIPPNGGSLFGRDKFLLRYINCFPIVQKQLGQDPDYYVMRRPPHVVINKDLGSTPPANSLHASFYDGGYGTLWFVAGQSIYNVNSFNSIQTIAASQMQGTPHVSSFTHYKVDTNDYIAILDNSEGFNNNLIYYYNRVDNTHAGTCNLDFRTNKIVFLDGYIFCASLNASNQRIYNTTLGNPFELLEGASFIDAEMHGDALITISKHHNHLVAFGTNSIEFFYNSSNELGSPLNRQANYAINIGLYDPGRPGDSTYTGWGVQEIDDQIYFLGSKNNNVIGLYVIDNFRVKKVSDSLGDRLLRNVTYPKLVPFDLYGEQCVLILDAARVTTPYLYIPSMELFVEMNWSFYPFHAAIVGANNRANSTILFKSDGGSGLIMYNSGDTAWDTQSPVSESFDSQYTTDFFDANNNSRKHWRFVEVLGNFGQNQVAIGYHNDNYGYSNAEFTNLPFKTQSSIGFDNTIRFRNLGQSRRQAWTVFFRGIDPYIYKGLAVRYNQWGD